MSGLVPWARGHSVFAQVPSTLIPYRYSQPESNLTAPTAPSGSFKDWWRELRGEVQETSGPMQSAVVGLRQNAEGAAIGALLALIDTDLGGLDLGGRIPLDWAGAALFYALSINDSTKLDNLSLDYRAMSQSCITIAMYRTVHKWREAKKGILQNTPQLTGDPIINAGKSVF